MSTVEKSEWSIRKFFVLLQLFFKTEIMLKWNAFTIEMIPAYTLHIILEKIK